MSDDCPSTGMQRFFAEELAKKDKRIAELEVELEKNRAFANAERDRAYDVRHFSEAAVKKLEKQVEELKEDVEGYEHLTKEWPQKLAHYQNRCAELRERADELASKLIAEARKLGWFPLVGPNGPEAALAFLVRQVLSWMQSAKEASQRIKTLDQHVSNMRVEVNDLQTKIKKLGGGV